MQLNTPNPNFEQRVSDIRREMIHIAEFVLSSFEIAISGIKNESIEELTEAREGNLKHVSYMTNAVDNSIVVALALHQPEARELRELIALLKCTNELTRIADASRKFSRGMQDIIEANIDISKIKNYIIELQNTTIKSMNLVIECLKEYSVDLSRAIRVEEEKSDDIFAIIKKEVLDIAPSNSELATNYIKILRAIKKHERVTDHCENIARLIHYAVEGGKLDLN